MATRLPRRHIRQRKRQQRHDQAGRRRPGGGRRDRPPSRPQLMPASSAQSSLRERPPWRRRDAGSRAGWAAPLLVDERIGVVVIAASSGSSKSRSKHGNTLLSPLGVESFHDLPTALPPTKVNAVVSLRLRHSSYCWTTRVTQDAAGIARLMCRPTRSPMRSGQPCGAVSQWRMAPRARSGACLTTG
jgi:hypothetical protein